MNSSSTAVLVVSFAADQACAASLAISAPAGTANSIAATARIEAINKRHHAFLQQTRLANFWGKALTRSPRDRRRCWSQRLCWQVLQDRSTQERGLPRCNPPLPWRPHLTNDAASWSAEASANNCINLFGKRLSQASPSSENQMFSSMRRFRSHATPSRIAHNIPICSVVKPVYEAGCSNAVISAPPSGSPERLA